MHLFAGELKKCVILPASPQYGSMRLPCQSATQPGRGRHHDEFPVIMSSFTLGEAEGKERLPPNMVRRCLVPEQLALSSVEGRDTMTKGAQ